MFQHWQIWTHGLPDCQNEPHSIFSGIFMDCIQRGETTTFHSTGCHLNWPWGWLKKYIQHTAKTLVYYSVRVWIFSFFVCLWHVHVCMQLVGHTASTLLLLHRQATMPPRRWNSPECKPTTKHWCVCVSAVKRMEHGHRGHKNAIFPCCHCTAQGTFRYWYVGWWHRNSLETFPWEEIRRVEVGKGTFQQAQQCIMFKCLECLGKWRYSIYFVYSIHCNGHQS